MSNLAEVMNKYPTVESTLCEACSNGWFFDKGRLLTCTTCGQDVVVYDTDEDFVGNSLETGAWIYSDHYDGLLKGIEAYKHRYPVAGYGTEAGPMTQNKDGDWAVRMHRSSCCD